MANSDNVVRAGLTPKFVDVETLAKITQYELKPLNVQYGEDNQLGGIVYQTPVEEFEVHFFSSESEVKELNLTSLEGASIAIILEGSFSIQQESQTYQKGETLLIPDCANLKGSLQVNSQLCLAKPRLT